MEGIKEVYLNIGDGQESPTPEERCHPRYRTTNAIPTDPIAMAILGLYGWEGLGGLCDSLEPRLGRSVTTNLDPPALIFQKYHVDPVGSGLAGLVSRICMGGPNIA